MKSWERASIGCSLLRIVGGGGAWPPATCSNWCPALHDGIAVPCDVRGGASTTTVPWAFAVRLREWERCHRRQANLQPRPRVRLAKKNQSRGSSFFHTDKVWTLASWIQSYIYIYNRIPTFTSLLGFSRVFVSIATHLVAWRRSAR